MRCERFERKGRAQSRIYLFTSGLLSRLTVSRMGMLRILSIVVVFHISQKRSTKLTNDALSQRSFSKIICGLLSCFEIIK